jgi:hypothetical protein
MHKRDQVHRMLPRDWLALPKDKRNDLARRAQMRSARIVPALYRQTLPPRALVRGQRPAGMQGETLEIDIEIERGRPQDAAQRNRDTGRYYLLEAVMMP